MSSDDAPRAPAELVDDPDDPELSELLDSALADFGRPLPAPASATAPATAPATATASTSASASASASATASSSAGPEEPNFGDAYKSFEEAMKQALKDAPAEGGQAEAAFSSMMANLAEEMAKTEVEGAEDPLAKTLADLSKTMTSDAEKMGGEPDMAELLRTFGGGGGGGGSGVASDAASLDAFMPLMQTVMSSILSKDVLYPSLKDVSDRYPAWLAEHGPALAEPELQRYQRQHQLMVDVCAVFEEEAAGAEAERARQERVFQLMQQMQALGQPPKELVGESDLGIQFDSEGNPRLPAGLGAAAGAECSVM